ncbi:hypothetical protein [Candidatus Solirubrobacter pratensis]|uniref:hypothetical protein n=1 Tax=Candidatus Solirubrobacter pratensis TaxID=1298857 RepID=UPI000403085A|nr:hypothetical protein [Candidatus Solirubrobacter pratensis]
MGRVWVLDTETKGTGAEMVPLEKLRKRPAPRVEPLFVAPKRKPREPKPPEPRPSLRFRIVDVMTRAVLADDAGTREALSVLNGVRSIVDVHVFLWQPKARKWRRLTLEEQRTLWERRAQAREPNAD